MSRPTTSDPAGAGPPGLVTLADGSGAPRLAQTRPAGDLLERYWAQLTDAMRGMAALGLAHGDLSPFDLLATEGRLVLIDLLASAF